MSETNQPKRTDTRAVENMVERGLISKELAEQVLARAGAETSAVDLLIREGHVTGRMVESLLDERGGEPTTISDFKILGKLGQGGMATVYKATQQRMNRQVALKVIDPLFSSNKEFCERFIREARVAGQINHPNVITCHDVGQDRGWLYMALELVTGGDAAQVAHQEGGKLSEARALRVIMDATRGLSALARAGLIHRDIKPANIFITEDGVAKLADLGLARPSADSERMTNAGMPVGTPAYMSPEQAAGDEAVDHRSDIYALGATLFALVTGQSPFAGANALAVLAQVQRDAAPDPRRLNPEVSDATAAIVFKAMAKNRDDRYATSEDLLEDLRLAAAGRPLRHAPIVPASRWPRRGDATRAVAAGAPIGAPPAAASAPIDAPTLIANLASPTTLAKRTVDWTRRMSSAIAGHDPRIDQERHQLVPWLVISLSTGALVAALLVTFWPHGGDAAPAPVEIAHQPTAPVDARTTLGARGDAARGGDARSATRSTSATADAATPVAPAADRARPGDAAATTHATTAPSDARPAVQPTTLATATTSATPSAAPRPIAQPTDANATSPPSTSPNVRAPSTDVAAPTPAAVTDAHGHAAGDSDRVDAHPPAHDAVATDDPAPATPANATPTDAAPTATDPGAARPIAVVREAGVPGNEDANAKHAATDAPAKNRISDAGVIADLATGGQPSTAAVAHVDPPATGASDAAAPSRDASTAADSAANGRPVADDHAAAAAATAAAAAIAAIDPRPLPTADAGGVHDTALAARADDAATSTAQPATAAASATTAAAIGAPGATDAIATANDPATDANAATAPAAVDDAPPPRDTIAGPDARDAATAPAARQPTPQEAVAATWQRYLDAQRFRCTVRATATGIEVVDVARETRDLAPLMAVPMESLDLSGCERLDGDLAPLGGKPATTLRSLNLARCKRLRRLDGLDRIPLERLTLTGCSELDGDLAALGSARLTKLDAAGCANLRSIAGVDRLPLTEVDLTDCKGLKGDLAPLAGKPITRLEITGCASLQGLHGIEGAPLTRIDLRGCRGLGGDLSALDGMRLERVELIGCESLGGLHGIEGLPLTDLNLTGCRKLKGDLSALRGMPLTRLYLVDCRRLVSLHGIEGMALTDVDLGDCESLRDLAPLRGMPLKRLSLAGCRDLTSLAGLEGMPLTELDLSSCSSLTPDLAPLAGAPLTQLNLTRCTSLTSLHGIEHAPLRRLVLTRTSRLEDKTALSTIRDVEVEK